ncbi:MAG: tetratricopeptide repeat protein [Terriglobia bacterium]
MILLILLGVSAQSRAQTPEIIAKSDRAKAAMSAGRFEEAAALYRELMRALPQNPGLRMNLGLALHSGGQYRAALEQFRVVVGQQPKNSAAWLLMGLGHLKLGEPALAVAPLRRALALDPRNHKARLELADAYLSSGQPHQAALQFKTLTEADPKDPKAWQGLGLSYVAVSRGAFEELEKSAPESAYARVLVARSFVSRKQYHAAFFQYRQALSAGPRMKGIHAGLAEVYRTTGHVEWAAIEDARERELGSPNCRAETLECDFGSERYARILEISKNGSTPVILFWRSRAASELALQAFDRLSQLPPSPAIHELMAEAESIQGRPELAVQEWNEALKLAPDDRRLKKGLARALRLNKEYEQARLLLQELVRTEPGSLDLQYELGEALLGTGQPEESLPYLERVVKSEPRNLSARAALGLAYLRAGRPQESIPHLKAASEIENDGSLYYQLAQAYQRSGQAALARETMQRFEEISGTARARRQKLPEEFEITPP